MGIGELKKSVGKSKKVWEILIIYKMWGKRLGNPKKNVGSLLIPTFLPGKGRAKPTVFGKSASKASVYISISPTISTSVGKG